MFVASNTLKRLGRLARFRTPHLPNSLRESKLIVPYARTQQHFSRTLSITQRRAAHSSSSFFEPPAPKRSRLFRFTRFGVVSLGFGGALTFWDDEYNDRTLGRNFRTIWNGVCVAVDYKLNFDPESLEAMNSLHERAAARLLNVCERNRGLYVKMGQAIGTQAAVLPAPYRQLAKLLDDAERIPYELVEKVIIQELGAHPDELFVRFDRDPVAAASIAQVHRARIRLPSGEEEEVAVKVQRPDIRRHAKWDLFAYRTMLHIYGWIFELPLSFFGQYISDQIEKETFFDNEAQNSEHIQRLILSSPSRLIRDTCYVPRIHFPYSTPRVLTMEWIDGACRLTDQKQIESIGLSVKEVMRGVCEVFAAQIFQMGFVQCDGHPSNVLVRQHPNGKRGRHQVVLIDHGLYVTLTPEFRHTYSELWHAIFTQDLPTIRRITEGWGMGQPELLASATLMRPWKAKGEHKRWHAEDSTNSEAMTPEEKKKRDLDRSKRMKEKLRTFLLNVELVPLELVFIGRCLRIMQANNQAMGSPVNRINILAHYAAQGLLSTAPRNGVSLTFTEHARSLIQARYTYLRFNLTLVVVDIAFYLTNFYVWLKAVQNQLSWSGPADKNGAGKKGFEDELEESMKRMAKNEFGVELGDDAFMG